MFQGKRFVTRGVVDSVPVGVQMFLWSIIDNQVSQNAMEIDYLQVFELQVTEKDGQQIVHRQEVPAYQCVYNFGKVDKPLNVKLYVIDNGEYCTMLLPEER